MVAGGHHARCLDVMASTPAGTLDRNDRYYIGRCGPRFTTMARVALPPARDVLTAAA